jgi:hypothetical protein
VSDCSSYSGTNAGCYGKSGNYLFQCVWAGNNCQGNQPGNSGGGIWNNVGACN